MSNKVKVYRNNGLWALVFVFCACTVDFAAESRVWDFYNSANAKSMPCYKLAKDVPPGSGRELSVCPHVALFDGVAPHLKTPAEWAKDPQLKVATKHAIVYYAYIVEGQHLLLQAALFVLPLLIGARQLLTRVFKRRTVLGGITALCVAWLAIAFLSYIVPARMLMLKTMEKHGWESDAGYVAAFPHLKVVAETHLYHVYPQVLLAMLCMVLDA